MTGQELWKLVEEVINASDRVHESGHHDGCAVCPIAEAITEAVMNTPESRAAILEAIVELTIQNDETALCVLLATFFCAGGQHARAQMRREYAYTDHPVA